MAFSGYQDFNPDFSNALQQLIAARPGITINSGYRSPQRQAELFAEAVEKYGTPEKARHWVAPPGQSRHNHGIAADLGFASAADREWAHANAEKFGLNFRMGHEPWHIELVGGKPTAVANDTSAPVSGSGSGSSAEYVPPMPERPARYPSDPFIPAQYDSANFSPGKVMDTQTLISMLSPRRAQAMEVFKKIKDFS